MALVRGLIREVAAGVWSQGKKGGQYRMPSVDHWISKPLGETPSEQSHKRGEKAPGNRLVTLQHAAQAVLILQNQQAA